MKKLRFLWWPVAQVYGLITYLRNFAFDRGWLRSTRAPVPVIGIGNLSVGGTGKTPMTEYLLEQFKDYPRAVVSRGYGRQSKGPLLVDPGGSPEDYGDEPLQIARRDEKVTVVVAEKRIKGVQLVLEKAEAPPLIILDDAFQHRWLQAGLYLLLTHYDRPFFSDQMLPQGRLREGRYAANRAQVIVVTKCPPDMGQAEMEHFRKKIGRHSNAPVLFSSLEYGPPTTARGHLLDAPRVAVVTGLAHSEELMSHLQKFYDISHHFDFFDHHAFTEADIQAIENHVQKENLPLVTTDKDWTRLQGRLSKSVRVKTFTVPVKHSFLENGELFLLSRLKEWIGRSIDKKKP